MRQLRYGAVDHSGRHEPGVGAVGHGRAAHISAPVSGLQPGEVSTQYQIGKDGMNKGMVLLGSAGGAVYRERPESVTQRRWQVTVKMDQGDQRVLLQSYEPSLHEGDRVHVYGTQLDLIQP